MPKVTMHHKLVTSRLIHNQSKKLPGSNSKLHRVGDSNTSSDGSSSSSESNMTTVAVNHVPLSLSLSHIVSMELGSDPVLSPGQNEQAAKVEQRRPPEPSKPKPQQGPPSIIYGGRKPDELADPRVSAVLPQPQQQQQHSIQMEQIRQLQLAMHTHFLYPQGPLPNQPTAATAYLEALARQHQQQVFAMAPAAPPDSTPAQRPIPIPESAASTPKRTRQESIDVQVEPEEPHKKLKRDSSSEEETAGVGDGEDDDDDDDDSSKGHRFRPYQYEQWTEKFQELCDFRKVKTHCQVPHTYTENPPLARWVKRQRYQYKLKMEHKQSTMTDERITLLENIGFIWDSHAAAWEEKLNELKEFNKANGDCNVPSTYPVNPQLATWVKCQRRQYKLLRDAKTSNMTLERIVELEKIGFVWEVRKNWESKRT